MKIIHISDLHFGLHHAFLIDPFLADIARIKPDLVLISGDIAHRAKSEQYQAFQVFLQQIKRPVCAVPGNHDLTPFFDPIARWLSPLKTYKTYVHPYVQEQFQNEELRLLGLNTANPFRIKDGKISDKSLNLIKEHFSAPFKGTNVLFFHHNFDYLEGWHKPLENYYEFLNYLKESPIDIVCTGHSHYAHISTIEKNNQESTLILHAGSLLCKRSKDGFNSYFVIDTEAGGCKVNWSVFKNEGFYSKRVYEHRYKISE